MAKQVFFGAPLGNLYVEIDNGAAGNTGDQNSVNPPGNTIVAGAGGYDNTPGNWGNAFGGAQFQNAAAVANANGSIPDFAVSPTKVLTNASTATLTWKNPA